MSAWQALRRTALLSSFIIGTWTGAALGDEPEAIGEITAPTRATSARLYGRPVSMDGRDVADVTPVADEAGTPRGPSDLIFIVNQDDSTFGFPNVFTSTIGTFLATTPQTVSLLGESNPRVVFTGIDSRPTTGVMFGIETTQRTLRVINCSTGASTIIGTPGALPLTAGSTGGLAFALDGSVAYATDSSKILTVNPDMGTTTTNVALTDGGVGVTYSISGLAVAPITFPNVPQGTLIGLAARRQGVSTGSIVAINPATGVVTLVTNLTLMSVPFPPFDVRFDAGLDFSPGGTLYACLQGNNDSGALFRVSLATATLGQATFVNYVSGSRFAWDQGGIAVESACAAADLRACCFSNGTCGDRLPADCAAQGGTAQGAGSACATTSCPTPQACCSPLGMCANALPAVCMAGGGTPQGAGTSCSTVTCPVPCDCAGDMSGNDIRSGGDIQAFVSCILGGGGNCACADMNNDHATNMADVAPFISALLNTPACP